MDALVYCWGSNQQGQLGDPARTDASSPGPALTAAVYTDVVAGEYHTCALRSDGVAVCWGGNDYGQLGIASAGAGSSVPVSALTNLRFAALSAGGQRTCGRVSDGTSYCWGAQWIGRGIDGLEITRAQSQPLRVSPTVEFRELAVGSQTICGLDPEGVAWCWEANPTGAMGDGTTAGSVTPTLVRTGQRFTALSVGGQSSCGVADTGEMYCWGADHVGQLAVSSASLGRRCGVALLPCAVSPLRTAGRRSFATVVAGIDDHFCGLTLAGALYCWGAGTMGQRGDGSVGAQWSPTRVPLP
jgi:alpha-tubulin suppressor-like RCC1 family protein